MRRKIWRMSEGQFTTVPRLKFEPESITASVLEGSTYQGGFSVIFSHGLSTKGICYCDNPYIYVVTPAFNDDNPFVSFAVLAENLRDGDSLEGNFHIYSDGQTHLLPFNINVKKKYPSSSLGEIRELEDLVELSRRNWKEAYQMFYSDGFADIMKTKGKYNLLYRGFVKADHSDANLEEFLTASGLKPRMTFELNKSSAEYSFINGNIKESIEITRNTWGFIEIEISTDSDFVSVENNIVTSDFFLGSKLSINYYIHKDRLHEGKNVCNIYFKGMGITRILTIVASTRDIHEKKHTKLLTMNRDIATLYNVYEEFRLKRMDALTWSEKTVALCESLLESDYLVSNRNFFRLIKTHALVVADKKKQALDMIIRLRSDIDDKKSSDWAYLLYLGALMEPTEEYVRRLCTDIEAILEDHPEDVRTFWFLLFIKKEFLRSPSYKLRSLRNWIMEGIDSPILFAECYDIYADDPYKLESIDDFSVKILNWAIKRKALTRPLADRIMDLLPKESQFSKLRFKIYRAAYQKAPTKDHLKTFVSYLLKNGAKGERFVSYYKKAIEDNILLTGVFESYVESLPLDYMEPISNMVLRYFSYESNVSDERKALVYANLVLFKSEEGSVYEQNTYRIHQFCIDQMRAGRIDDNLIVCYQDILDNGLVDSKLADAALNVIFAKKIICLAPDARRIIIVEDQFKEPVVSTLNQHMSFIPIYTRDMQVLIEKFDGTITTDSNLYYVENVLDTDNVYEKIKFLATDTTSTFYHDFSLMEGSDEVSEIYEQQLSEAMFSEVFNEDYIISKFNIFMGYFREKNKEDVILLALLHKNRFKFFESAVITYMTELLISAGEDKRALDILLNYIVPFPDKKLLLSLLRRITTNPAVSRGEFVLELCITLLREGYHSEETVEYLLHHFIGTTDDMRLIFKYADHESPAFMAFVERLIIQGLYAHNILPGDDEIMIAYLEDRANPMIVEAYISYFCHLYMIENQMPPQSVFAILFRQLRVTDSINDVCRFAYSKFLCHKSELSHQERSILNILINEQLNRGIYFTFYKYMDEELIMKYNIYDRLYIEAEFESKKDLVMEYVSRDNHFTTDMIESYEGIYVKDLVVFFGDTVTYKVYERSRPEVVITTGEATYTDVGFLNESRYYVINNMQQKLFYKETDSLKDDIFNYNDRLNAVGEVFSII